LVLLIGSNGSGKSCVFDAFDYVSKSWKNISKEDVTYYQKQKDIDFNIYLTLPEGHISSMYNIEDSDKKAVYYKCINTEFKGVVDRDFLADKEIESLEEDYPNLKVLRYYSIENYLYHPDNLAEYYNKINKTFDKEDYIQQLVVNKNKVKNRLTLKLMTTRTSYPFYKEVQKKKNPKKKWYTNSDENADFTEKVALLLNSDNLEDFYKFFPMKNFATQIPQRQNIPLSELTKTIWFEKQIKNIIN